MGIPPPPRWRPSGAINDGFNLLRGRKLLALLIEGHQNGLILNDVDPASNILPLEPFYFQLYEKTQKLRKPPVSTEDFLPILSFR